jgi:hypothetical protein
MRRSRRLRRRLGWAIKPAMTQRQPIAITRASAFADATARALSSTLLLLGLIGDRRVR